MTHSTARPDVAPRFGLVVPCHRLGPELEACLASLAALDPAPVDAVLVFDGPGVEGPVLEQRAASAFEAPAPFRQIDLERPSGPAAARNAGVEALDSSVDVVLFCDSDILAPPDLIARFARHFTSGHDATDRGLSVSVDAVIGSYDDAPTARGLVSSYRNLLHHWVHQQGGERAIFSFWGACGAVRRAAFDAVGGFDRRYRRPSIEDIELGARLRHAGARLVLDPTIQVRHQKRWDFVSMVRTDIFDRALPWSRLLLAEGALPNDLNLRTGQRVGVALAGLGAAAGALALLTRRLGWLGVSLGAAAGLAWLERRFLGFLRRRRGFAWALRAAPLHALYFFDAGLGLSLALLERGLARHSRSPVASSESSSKHGDRSTRR